MTQAGSAAHGRLGGYELRVLLLLGLAYGFAYFDRMAMTFLGPLVKADLSLTWALGAYFVGRWSAPSCWRCAA